MLARDQIKQVAQEIDRTADQRMRYCDDRFDQQQLWEVVRRACRVIETVSELDDGELAPDIRSRRARYVLDELESALEAARKAKVVVDWTAYREPDDF